MLVGRVSGVGTAPETNQPTIAALHLFAYQCACTRYMNFHLSSYTYFLPLYLATSPLIKVLKAAVASRVNTHSGNTDIGMGTDLSINAAKYLCCRSKLKGTCRDPAGWWSWTMHRKLCTAHKDEGVRFNVHPSSHCRK